MTRDNCFCIFFSIYQWQQRATVSSRYSGRSKLLTKSLLLNVFKLVKIKVFRLQRPSGWQIIVRRKGFFNRRLCICSRQDVSYRQRLIIVFCGLVSHPGKSIQVGFSIRLFISHFINLVVYVNVSKRNYVCCIYLYVRLGCLLCIRATVA